MEFFRVSLQQNVGKNRQSGAGADYVLDLLQTFEQFFFRNTKFHYNRQAVLRCKAFDFIRQPQSLQCRGGVDGQSDDGGSDRGSRNRN